MKKTGLAIVIICLLGIQLGCGIGPAAQTAGGQTGEFDFAQYDNQEMTVFLEAYGLVEDDYSAEGIGNYQITKELPFGDTMAFYRLICDEEGRIAMITVFFQNEGGLNADFNSIQKLCDSYNGQEGVSYMYDLEEYQGVPNINSYKTAEELEVAIRQTKEAPQTERDQYFFSLKGIWNGKDSVQTVMQYTFRMEDEASGIELQFCNSESPLAVSFDHTAPEGVSLFPES